MQSFVNVWIHAVWSTKEREPLLGKRWRNDLFQVCREVAREKEIHLDFINGVEDHVHALVCLRSTQTVSDCMRLLKGLSSHWINENRLIEGEFHWQNGYAAFSVSPNQIHHVRNYIRNQENHHRNNGFVEELGFLKRESLKAR